MNKILLLNGDGIGPEIMAQAKKVLDFFNFPYEEGDIGGGAIDKFGTPFPAVTQAQAENAMAVLLGAVGGPKWDSLPLDKRPEKGLLAIRESLALYANLRPLDIWPQLCAFSPLKAEVLTNVSFVIVRELTGDLYFGSPRGIESENGQRRGFNTMVYNETEIKKISHRAFQLAQLRQKKLCSIDKANVLETMVLWREIVTEIHQQYPDVQLSHMYVDNAAMQLIRKPSAFDVILTPNMFGDILSDEAAVLAGSLGLLASASLGEKHALYEPIHGSAPDIAGKNIANPIGMILSVALMFEFTFQESEFAKKIRVAINDVLNRGYRTADIWSENTIKISTDEMGDKIVETL